ncbi:MAG: hypothetical protein JW751_30700 [Polyangiaceae bacterium]|nr:hypothetical protein [Polyangiaceae bacterium]
MPRGLDDEPPVDDAPGRVVGRRSPPAALSRPGDTKDAARAWRRAFPTPFVPRGVYRFASHEAADEWLLRMLTRTRDR